MFKKAQKTQSKLRLALMGPSGAGKTFTALSLARGMVPDGRIALIDTEHGSASKYSDKFSFDVCELESFSIDNYINTIREAELAGYDLLIIDSLSHAWSGKDGALESVDKAAARMKTPNSYTAWRDVTPAWNRLLEAITGARMHVIGTLRSKMEYALEKDEKTGKASPRKLGLAPIFRDNSEYEFDIVADIDLDHNMIVSKTRCEMLDGGVFHKAGQDVADKILGWLNDGEPEVEIDRAALTTEIITMLRKEGKTDKAIETAQAKLAQMPGRVFMETLAEVRARHEVATDAAETYARRAS